MGSDTIKYWSVLVASAANTLLTCRASAPGDGLSTSGFANLLFFRRPIRWRKEVACSHLPWLGLARPIDDG